ncbi:hypothetical protein [Clostridioides difficile]|uniref:hypothetical protein n=1 Tax=Clostridioides difficile TaxID=1496 RepID=UPI002F3F6B41
MNFLQIKIYRIAFLVIIVPSYTNTTIDDSFMSAEQSYKYYNRFIWNGRYSECILLDETLKRMK